MLTLSFGLYLFSYWWGFHSLCILSLATMNLITFQAGNSFNEYYTKTIHLNQFDELDVSTSSDNSDTIDELSLKQREHGATSSRGMTEEQEEKLYQQLREVVDETGFRNRKRRSLATGHTPSSTSLCEDGEISSYPPIPQSDVEDDNDDYTDMPGLVRVDEKDPVIKPIYSVNNAWTNVPNFSQTHYLHNYMEDLD